VIVRRTVRGTLFVGRKCVGVLEVCFVSGCFASPSHEPVIVRRTVKGTLFVGRKCVGVLEVF